LLLSFKKEVRFGLKAQGFFNRSLRVTILCENKDFDEKSKMAREKSESLKKSLGISVKVYITDLEEKLKDNYLTLNVEEISEEDLNKKIFKVHTKAMENYAAEIGAIVEL